MRNTWLEQKDHLRKRTRPTDEEYATSGRLRSARLQGIEKYGARGTEGKTDMTLHLIPLGKLAIGWDVEIDYIRWLISEGYLKATHLPNGKKDLRRDQDVRVNVIDLKEFVGKLHTGRHKFSNNNPT